MKRRAFISAFGGAAAVWPIAARAQQPSRVWRVGYFGSARQTEYTRSLFEAFHLRLQELGYVEGRNFILVRRADVVDLHDPDLLQPPLDRSFKRPGGYVLRDKLDEARKRAAK